jgi:adenylate cyclase
MLQSKDGMISYKDRSYYYLHMTPFPELDLHFFILSLEKDAFGLVHAIDQDSRQTVKDISWNMRLISLAALSAVLILLHALSKKITKPITHLAHVTQDVVAGRLEDIVIPKTAENSKDEISILCNSFEQMIQGLKEKEKVKGILNKVVSQEIAKEFLKGDIHLGGEEKIVTVLFADIRNFTRMSNNKAPHIVIEMLNRCMTKVSHVIDEYGGVIDKYVGDEVMALFGAPIHKEDSALKAIMSALKIVEVLNEWNLEREKNHLERIEMGIGIHTGNVLVGNMGAENRLNYTVIGSNVNLAARLCSAAKGMQIVISKDTYEQPMVNAQVVVEPLPPMELKGFEEKIRAFWVKGLKT